MRMLSRLVAVLFITWLLPNTVAAQEPVSWGKDLTFHTFSIAAIDRETGEVGVAVTTRVACVGNGVPWVRAGVGAVATQASTRTEYGIQLLNLIADGMTAETALRAAVAADPRAARRQVGVVGLRGGTAQHTGCVDFALDAVKLREQRSSIVEPIACESQLHVLDQVATAARIECLVRRG